LISGKLKKGVFQEHDGNMRILTRIAWKLFYTDDVNVYRLIQQTDQFYRDGFTENGWDRGHTQLRATHLGIMYCTYPKYDVNYSYLLLDGVATLIV
jgi:hypothetical protein